VLLNPKSETPTPRWLFAAALLLCAAPVLAVDYAPLSPDPAAFKGRRERFMAQLPPKSVAILRSAPMRTMTNDVEYIYRQDNDFYYLTGILEDDVTALLRPDAPDGKKYVLFLRPRDLRREAWAGVRVGPDEAVAAYGADAAFPLKDFEAKLAEFDPNTYKRSGYLVGMDKLYVSDGHDEAWEEKFQKDYKEMRSGDEGPATIVDARGICVAPPRCPRRATCGPCRRRRRTSGSSRCRPRSTGTATPTGRAAWRTPRSWDRVRTPAPSTTTRAIAR
jgi:hypothetical protein